MATELLHPDPHALPFEEDAEDPELLALPPPPKAQRQLTVLLLAFVALTGAAMAVGLRGEAAYALAPTSVTDIGDLYAFDGSKALSNQYVQGRGTLGGALAIRFERPFESDTYRVSPILGKQNVWVEVRVPEGEEGARYVPPTSFSGRLVRWSESGLRHRGLERAVDSLTSEAIPADGWLLVDGESPSSARWALFLAVMFAGFAAWSVLTAARLIRRVA